MAKIGVISGTSKDAEIGVNIFRKHDVIGCSISNNPQEQTRLQALDKVQLTRKVQKAIDLLIDKGAESIVIYCNSISGSIDLKYLRSENKQKIITPFDIYEKITNNHKVFGLLAANCQSTANIEKLILKSNKNAVVIGLGNLNVVNDIEKGHKPDEIIKKHKLVEICDVLSQSGAEIIILGCTHFSFFHKELQELIKIPLLEPSVDMTKIL